MPCLRVQALPLLPCTLPLLRVQALIPPPPPQPVHLQELMAPFCYDRKGEVKAGEAGWFARPVLNFYQVAAGGGTGGRRAGGFVCVCVCVCRCQPASTDLTQRTSACCCTRACFRPPLIAIVLQGYLTVYYNDRMIREAQRFSEVPRLTPRQEEVGVRWV